MTVADLKAPGSFTKHRCQRNGAKQNPQTPGSHLKRFQCNRVGGAPGIGIHKHPLEVLPGSWEQHGTGTGLESSVLRMHLYDPFHHLIKAGEQGKPYPLLWALLVSNPPAKKDANIYSLFHRAPWRCSARGWEQRRMCSACCLPALSPAHPRGNLMMSQAQTLLGRQRNEMWDRRQEAFRTYQNHLYSPSWSHHTHTLPWEEEPDSVVQVRVLWTAWHTLRSACMLPSEAPGSGVVEGQGDVQTACASGVSSSQWSSTTGDLPATPRTLGFAHRHRHKWGAVTASSRQRPEMLLHVRQGTGRPPKHCRVADDDPPWADCTVIGDGGLCGTWAPHSVTLWVTWFKINPNKSQNPTPENPWKQKTLPATLWSWQGSERPDRGLSWPEGRRLSFRRVPGEPCKALHH